MNSSHKPVKTIPSYQGFLSPKPTPMGVWFWIKEFFTLIATLLLMCLCIGLFAFLLIILYTTINDIKSTQDKHQIKVVSRYY